VPMVLESLRCEYLFAFAPLGRVPHLSPRIKVLTGELEPMAGHVTRNGRLRVSVMFLSYANSPRLIRAGTVEATLPSIMWTH